MRPRTLQSRWSLAVAAVAAVALAAAAVPSVSGHYRANGKDAKLAHVLAVAHEDFAGQPAVTLVFTEKDTAGDPRADIAASFGNFGSALTVSLLRDGSVFGCEVGHAALKHMGASSIGKLKSEGFTWANGEVSGKLTTHGPVDLFDETWDVELSFRAKAP
jgi:hypothetical protein